jgi:hypothetical protein
VSKIVKNDKKSFLGSLDFDLGAKNFETVILKVTCDYISNTLIKYYKLSINSFCAW